MKKYKIGYIYISQFISEHTEYKYIFIPLGKFSENRLEILYLSVQDPQLQHLEGKISKFWDDCNIDRHSKELIKS